MHTKENAPFLQQGLPHRDWAGVLPTQKFLYSNLVTPESFVQLCPSIQKLFMIFFNTDRWTHKLHTKRITPLPTGHKKFITHFFYLSHKGVCLFRWLNSFCSDNNVLSHLETNKSVLLDNFGTILNTIVRCQNKVCQIFKN